MPEYLAPGVYVEETSFRAKSIEGVGTSTAAFVGPTRKGPIAPKTDTTPPPLPPELLTSYGDFVRVFGGLEPLDFAPSKPNYLAHAVLNFFNESGSRLYVVRTAQAPKPAKLRLAGADDSAANRVVLHARFPGSAGNGTVVAREILSAATGKNLAEASAGTLLRARGALPEEPARIISTRPGPFAVHNAGVLRLMVNGAKLDLVFQGKATESKGDTDLADKITLEDASHTLTVTINGTAQDLTLANQDYTPVELALAVNQQMRGGYARLDGKKLVIGTDSLGYASTVKVLKNEKFGFKNDGDGKADFDVATNNVANLDAVTATDLRKILGNDQNPPSGDVIAEENLGQLMLTTRKKGEDASLAVADATDAVAKTVSNHAAFGLLPPMPGASPARGSNVRIFRKGDDGIWKSADNTQFNPPADLAAEAGSFISLALSVSDDGGDSEVFDEVSLVKTDTRYLGAVLPQNPTNRADALRQLIWVDVGDTVDSLSLHAALFAKPDPETDTKTGLGVTRTLIGGNDGNEPLAGAPDQEGSYASALEQLRGLEDVSIVAAPGHSSFDSINYQAIQYLLIQHVEKPRAYRIGVIETPPEQTPGQARIERSRIDSHRVALYYPWVTAANPLARPGSRQPREINLPPSGFICGIYARNDVQNDVSKAPANEVVRGALRFESDINFAQNQLLNPLGVNCLRFFPGRGYRVWGARTASSDPEWKYVNVRRYFNYLEASIDRGTQWAVFENNGPRLWQNIRETIEDFLYNEWVSNRLLGDNPKQAYFVRCDRSTMTQNDLDNGRLICLIGVAALKPAEFVIFRIGQKTADTRS